MGIFQRFEDEAPAIVVAGFVALAILLILLPLTLYVFDVTPALKPFQLELSLIISFGAAGVAVAITLGKLKKP